jgi:copper homeostasis protein
MTKLLLEAPVFTVEAALKAAEFGVDRLELCSDFGEGGETPSAGALAYLKQKVKIPVFVMIRPRGGDFVYTEDEIAVMKKDIQVLKSLGADGFVFGILKSDGKINMGACEELLADAQGLPCTFHRAFDISLILEKSLEAIIECGFRRILTSGGENSVNLGLSVIQKLLVQAADRIVIMPGGGLLPHHVPVLMESVGLREIHASCKIYRNSESTFIHPRVLLSNDPESFKSVLTISEEKVRQFKQAMQPK